MKIVIDVPDVVYKAFKDGSSSIVVDCIISNAVFDGQPLPKGHGRLIDADALFEEYEKTGWYNNADRDEVAEKILLDAPTIIEADEEGGNAEN